MHKAKFSLIVTDIICGIVVVLLFSGATCAMFALIALIDGH
jgi:hypothetical protein